MCFSKVYMNKRDDNSLLMDDVSLVIHKDGQLAVNTILGEEKNLTDYIISEVNLMDNYIILKQKD